MLKVHPCCHKQQDSLLSRGQIIFHWVYVSHLFLIHLSIDGHLGYFNIMAIENNAVINRCVHIMHQYPVFISFGYSHIHSWSSSIHFPHSIQCEYYFIPRFKLLNFPTALNRACKTGDSGPCPPLLPPLLSSLTASPPGTCHSEQLPVFWTCCAAS